MVNPVATFGTAAEMLSWLDEKAAAKTLMDIVEMVGNAGVLRSYLGSNVSTNDVTQAVCKEIEKLQGYDRTHMYKILSFSHCSKIFF